MVVKQAKKERFSPCKNECTTFPKVRVLRFAEGALDIEVRYGDEKLLLTNTKSFEMYYDTDKIKILNTLQEVRLAYEKIKIKDTLGEIISISDIEKRLQEWLTRQ